jgi:RimJ/RimL family protein N-acetyltransferase
MLHACPPDPPHGLVVRAIRADDKDALADLFARLSDRSRRRRFHASKPGLSARELAYLTEIDGRRHAALVAVEPGGRFAAVARYACEAGIDDEADVAFAVADAWHGRGIGTDLGRRLLDHARASGIAQLRATTMGENRPAQRLLRGLGFVVVSADASGIELELSLAGATPAPSRVAA